MQRATVMAVHRERYELFMDSMTFYGRLKAADFYNAKEIVDFPTVGDEVELIYNESGDSLITKVLPRKSVFLRLNATQGLPDQAVAANFDYVFITMSLNRDFHISKLERYLTVAWQSGGTPVIVLTKADLCEVREMNTGGIREADAQGRHTTTYKQCMFLPENITLPTGESLSGGGRIIDTPGMRRLLAGEVEEGIQTSFEDIETLIAACRFSDCRHETEPGCAVRAALEDGTLDKRRWKTYQSLQGEEAYSRERKEIMMKRIGKARKGIKQKKDFERRGGRR